MPGGEQTGGHVDEMVVGGVVVVTVVGVTVCLHLQVFRALS